VTYKNKAVQTEETKTVAKTETVVEGRKGSISAVMDPLLLEGGRTVQEIAAEVASRVGSAVEGKKLVNYVRVRLTTLSKKGYTVEKSEGKKVRLVKNS
jgi:hypothetical protein